MFSRCINLVWLVTCGLLARQATNQRPPSPTSFSQARPRIVLDPFVRQTVAAVVIQKAYRRHLFVVTLTQTIVQRRERTLLYRHQRATDIQRVYRGYVDRTAVTVIRYNTLAKPRRPPHHGSTFSIPFFFSYFSYSCLGFSCARVCVSAVSNATRVSCGSVPSFVAGLATFKPSTPDASPRFTVPLLDSQLAAFACTSGRGGTSTERPRPNEPPRWLGTWRSGA